MNIPPKHRMTSFLEPDLAYMDITRNSIVPSHQASVNAVEHYYFGNRKQSYAYPSTSN